jgi:hypothetical protein
MEEIVHYANFSFEFDLYQRLSSKKAAQYNKELDYLYSLFGECAPLAVHSLWEEEYLDRLVKLGYQRPKLVPYKQNENYQLWVGDPTNLKLEQKLNSKITSLNQREKYREQPFHSFIFQNASEFESQAKEGVEYLVKSPYAMSGEFFYKYRKGDSVDLPTISHDWIAEEYLEIVENISLVKIQNEYHFLRHLPSHKFAYAGTYYYPTIREFRQSLVPIWSPEFEEQLLDVARLYESLGAGEYFSIDAFLYRYKGQLHFNPLSEVNHRKTMGMITRKIGEHLLLNRSGMVSFNPSSRALSGAVELSPGSRRFKLQLKSL